MAEGCGALADGALAEVALGVADAQDRAAVLAHVEACPVCRHELRAMTQVADGLLDLVPTAEPPVGFETRVLAATQPAPATQPVPAARERRWPRLAVAAAVVAAALGGGLAVASALSSPPSQAGGSGVEAATLRAHDRTIGEVVVVEHPRPWMSLRLDGGPYETSVRCQVVGVDGRRITVGTFWVAGGSGYWSAPLPLSVTVSQARLVLPGGKVLATATLPAR